MNKGNVTTVINGGLGNQMFQYAAGYALSLRLNVQLQFDISWFFYNNLDTQRNFLLPVFPNIETNTKKLITCRPSFFHRFIKKINIISQKKYGHQCPFCGSVATEPYFSYWPGIEELSSPISIHGYWQSEKYFSKYSEKIRNKFTFPQLPNENAIYIEKKICASSQSVSVHIRRGDYANNEQTKSYHGLIGQDYYSRALEYLKKNIGRCSLFIFSDEPDWVRRHFDCCGHDAIIVDFQLSSEPQHDMHLMSLCRHHILANSSFSWWGAWLGVTEGITIAPSRWFANEKIVTNTLYPEHWLKY